MAKLGALAKIGANQSVPILSDSCRDGFGRMFGVGAQENG